MDKYHLMTKEEIQEFRKASNYTADGAPGFQWASEYLCVNTTPDKRLEMVKDSFKHGCGLFPFGGYESIIASTNYLVCKAQELFEEKQNA